MPDEIRSTALVLLIVLAVLVIPPILFRLMLKVWYEEKAKFLLDMMKISKAWDAQMENRGDSNVTTQ